MSPLKKKKRLRSSTLNNEYSNDVVHVVLLKSTFVIFFCLVFLFKNKNDCKHLLVFSSVLKKNFLKKKLPVSFFFLNFLIFFVFFKTIVSLLEIRLNFENFFLKKIFFLLNVLFSLVWSSRALKRNLLKKKFIKKKIKLIIVWHCFLKIYL